MAEKHEVHVELLIGKRVLALNGKSIGRLEEIRTQTIRGQQFVVEFMVGSYAVFERLAALTMGRVILRLVGMRRKEGYRIPWDKLDLSNPEQPRITCNVSELKPLRD